MAAGISFYPLKNTDSDVPALSLELNNECPLSCPDCFLLRNRDLLTSPLKKTEWIDILNVAARMSPNLRTVYVHGQEVSMVPELLADVVSEFRRLQRNGFFKNTEIGFISSGIGAQKIVDSFAARSVNVDQCAVSIDGYDIPSNTIFRGALNAFAQACKGAQILSSYVGRKGFSIATMIGPKNLNTLPKMADFVRSEGWSSLVVSVLAETDKRGVFVPTLTGRQFRFQMDLLAKHFEQSSIDDLLVQGQAIDDIDWANEAVGNIQSGAVKVLFGNAKSGVNIRRSSPIEQITRVRYDGLIMQGREIFEPQITSSNFVDANCYANLATGLQRADCTFSKQAVA